jgi:hypothetical protein
LTGRQAGCIIRYKQKQRRLQEMETTLIIRTVTGKEMVITGKNYRFDENTNCHYLGAGSYPNEIVVEVK